MFTPAVRMYKEKYPNATLGILTLSLTAPLWKNNRHIDAVFESKHFHQPPNHGNYFKYVQQRIIIQKEIQEVVKIFAPSKIEYIIPHAYLICGVNFPVPGVLRRFFFDRFENHELLRLCKRLKVGAAKHWPTDYYQELDIPRNSRAKARKILTKKKIPHKFCIIHCEASSQNKALSNQEKEDIILSVKESGYTVVLLQDDSLRIDVTPICTNDILASAALIKECDLFIGVDSGPSHIAEVLDKKRIIISKIFKTKLLYLECQKSFVFDGFDGSKIRKAIKQLSSNENNLKSDH